MGKYLKLFNQDADYKAFKETEEYILPNVSYVEDINVVYYNPYEEPKSPNLVCTYDITDISQNTQILNSYGLGSMANMIVDGIEMDVETHYQFDTVGNHVVEFVLDDPTSIGNVAFYDCKSLTSVVIPDSVTSIGYVAFYGCSGLTEVHIGSGVTTIGDSAFSSCSGLTSIVIPDSVTTIGDAAFAYCSGLTSVNIPDSVTTIDMNAFSSCTGLTSITCNAITAPTISNNTFYEVAKNGVLKVPAGSDYSSWMSIDEYYLGYRNWTVEYI